jgi:23S rRNA pseudouridine1911/1915/1917 synthase
MDCDSNEVSPLVLEASEADAGIRLDVFLARELKVSRGRAQKLADGALLAGSPLKPSHVLKAGDKVTLKAEPAAVVEAAVLPSEIDEPLPPIIYEDDYLMVLNKPRGVVVHAGAGEQGATLVEILQSHGRVLSTVGPAERAGIVHRLDKDTSGVIVVCKTDEAHWKLTEAFAARTIKKEYAALVCGVPKSPGRIEAPISRHPVHRKKMAVAPGGRPAVTEYETVKTWQKYALLKINLLTGRTHQIRVHFHYLNHPVVGDDVYGGLKRALENAPSPIAQKAIENLNGQALHAARLEFAHPITGQTVICHAPLPDKIQAIVSALDEEVPPPYKFH